MCWVFQSWLILLLLEGQCPDDPCSGNLTDRPAEGLSLQWVHLYLTFLSSVHFPTLNSAWCLPIQRSVVLSSGKIVLAIVIAGSSRMECRRAPGTPFIVVVRLLSYVQLFATPRAAAHQTLLALTVSREFALVHVHWVGDAILILYSALFQSVSFTTIFRENSKSLTSETFEHSVVTYQVASWLSQLLVYNLLSRVPRLPWWFRW